MCRVFGLSAGQQEVGARFWLLDAPDSLEAQGRRNPDGTGLGYFAPDGAPVQEREPEPAYADAEFISAATQATARTFVAHVRVLTTGEPALRNTHPFCIDGRLMAHNGGFAGLDRMDAELGDYRQQVAGETDSERFLALISQRIQGHDGDVGAGITSAARWISANLPMYSLNLVLITPDELWALRYPEFHKLYVLERPAGGPHGSRQLHGASDTMAVHSPLLANHPSVVVASEPMDDNPDWTLLAPGELVHVAADLAVTRRMVLPDPPARFELPRIAEHLDR